MLQQRNQSAESSAVQTQSRLPRYRRVETYQKISIGRPKHHILEAVGCFDYLSAPQLARLLFSPNSLTYVRDHLKELYQAAYLQRLYLPSLTPFGSALAVYCLDRKGISYLRGAGLAPTGRFNPAEQAERQAYFLRHTLACNDLLIQCHQLEAVSSETELQNFITERQLKRKPGYTRISGKRVTVIPDGWSHLQHQWPGRARKTNYYISWELDRGTIEQKAFRKKIRYLVSFIEDGYEKRFGVTGLTFSVVTTHSPKRVDALVSWTEDELTERGLEEYSDLFLFTHFNAAEIPSASFAFAPLWVQPFSNKFVPLLEQPFS